MDKPTFYGIIPANVRYAKIADRAKLIFSEITALSNKWGYCNASNGYFAQVWECDPSVISRHVSSLESIGAIRCEYIREGKQVKERRIYPLAMGGVLHPVQEGIACGAKGVLHHMQGGIAPEIKENTTRFNNTSLNNKKEYIVETSSTPFLSENEIEDIEQQIYHSKTTEPKRKKVAQKKEKVTDDPTPIRAMFELYADKYAELNNGVKPEFMVKYTPAMKNLYGILRARSITSGFVPLDNLEPWRDFLTTWTDYLAKNEKEKWHRDNFNPLTFFSQFNSIIAKLNNRPKTDAEKWMDFARRNGVL